MGVVGLLGGTFDPPHRGHRALAAAALACGRLDAVWLVPSARPPHKDRPGMSSPGHRLAMARLLAESLGRTEVSDIELRREGPSFTVDTVRELARLHPDRRFRLVIGWDMAVSFATWREAGRLARLAPPLVAWRPSPGTALGTPAKNPDCFGEWPEILRTIPGHPCGEMCLPMRPDSVSSTAVRAALANGQPRPFPPDWLVPAVSAYIKRHHLYADPVPPDPPEPR